MDDYRWNYHVPAFGSWGYGDADDGMPYTQCFESARQANNLARFAYSDVDERDLYVTGDLYQNNVVTPAVIVVPRRRRKGGGYSSSNVKGVKKQQQSMVQKKQEYEYEYGGGYSYDNIKEPPSPILSPPKHNNNFNNKPKPVDEDLYKIPPEFLHVKPKRKKGLGLFSSCLLPACA